MKTDAARRVIDVPARFRHKVLDILGIDELTSGRIAANYPRGQMPFMKGKSLHDNFSYCQDRLHKMRSWTSA